MFETLYTRRVSLNRHRRGPLAKERLAFLQQLADEGLTRPNLLIAASYLLLIASRLGLASRSREMIGLSEIEKEAADWARRKTGRFKKGAYSDRARQRFTGFAVRWLTFLKRFDTPPTPVTPFDEWLDQFAEHLRGEKGLACGTVRLHRNYVREFLCRLNVAPAELAKIKFAQVERALTEHLEQARWARSTVQSFVSALRGFFRFADRSAWVPRGVANILESPRIYRDEQIPVGPSWDDVQRLIATTDGGRPIDIRDRALLLLLAVYGFRAGEVVGLKLDHIDWQSDTLAVQRGKSKKTQTFPLCRTVGDAILRYLREVRPESPHRELFFQYHRPLPIRPNGLTRIVQKRLKAGNILLPRPGAHALRHACATHLLEQGLTLKEIGDHLGHRSPDSTRIYAKVNITQLRRVAELDLGGVV